MGILANQTFQYSYDETEQAFKPTANGGDDVFTLRQLNYWQWQDLIALDQTPVAEIKLALQLALVAIGGSEDRVKEFLASPNARVVNPLFRAIVELAAGN